MLDLRHLSFSLFQIDFSTDLCGIGHSSMCTDYKYYFTQM